MNYSIFIVVIATLPIFCFCCFDFTISGAFRAIADYLCTDICKLINTVKKPKNSVR